MIIINIYGVGIGVRNPTLEMENCSGVELSARTDDRWRSALNFWGLSRMEPKDFEVTGG